jgi:hypothetical protein
MALFVSRFLEVLRVDPVGGTYESLIPAVISGLLAPDQQHGLPPGIERVENAIGPTAVLNPEFPHVGVAAVFDPGAVRVPE